MIFFEEQKAKDKKFSYLEGISKENYKDGGMNKLTLVALLEDSSFNSVTFNLNKIIEMLGMNSNCAFNTKLAYIYILE